jgi:arabinan endo-1,5-alpha-L-arabinosidase
MLVKHAAALLGVALVAASGVLGGCAGKAASAHPSASSGSAHADASTFVIDQDFPDPDVLVSGGNYYLYATNAAGFNIQLATSKNLMKWTVTDTDVLPKLPSWAQKGNTWAPDVSEPAPGDFRMYFVAREPKSGKQCIGFATAASARGPFTSAAARPLICNIAEGGDIDPSTFTDSDGTHYLVWKNDGNCCGLDTWLQVAKLNSRGDALAGPTTRLIKQSQSWEGNLVEAPTLVHHGSKYTLFYSANDYSADKYAIGFASSTSLLGPYVKHTTPLLSTAISHGKYRGPGGQDVVLGPGGRDYLIFHSWDPAYIYRGVNVLTLGWHESTPILR